jgi:glycosyltransferase involved in cell wall biosynthesis
LATAVVANSDATMATIPAIDGPARVVASPVDPAIVLARRTPASARQPVSTVGMVGRIARWKGQDVFLRAFAEAFPDGPQTARIVGAPLFGADDRAFGDELEALARDLGIADRVELRGHRDDVADELAHLDVLVHASVVPEPLGMVVAEGLAAGLPVVATEGGGPSELIRDGVDGLLVARGDAGALASALRRLAGDADLRAGLSEAAPARVADLTPEAAAAAVESLYEEILQRGRS